MRPHALIGVCALACSPPAVVPTVTSAAITVDSDSPLALARVDAVVILDVARAGTVDLAAARLSDADGAQPLVLAFSDAFDPEVDEGTEVTAVVTNVGTSNATLDPWCRADATLTVEVELLGEPAVASDPFEVTVVCFGG